MTDDRAANRGSGAGRAVDRKQGLWPLRLLSLVIAVTLWLVYSYSGREQPRVERAFDVTVTYTVPEDLLVLDPTTSVSVRLSGTEDLMAALTPFQLGVSAEVVPEAGLQEILLNEQTVTRPENVAVVSITPARLSLQVDEVIEKRLRVTVDPGGTEVSGGAVWLIGESVVRPEFLRFRGPKSLLQDRDAVSVRIDLRNHLTAYTTRLAVEPIHELVQAVGPSIVEVRVAIEEPELPGDNQLDEPE